MSVRVGLGAVAAAIGVTLLGPQAGVAQADTAADDTASLTRSPARHSAVTRTAARPSTPVGAQRPAAAAGRVSTPQRRQSARTAAPQPRSTAVGRVAAVLCNRTPTLNPAQNAPDAAGVVTGVLNGADPDSAVLSYEVVRQPEYGRVAIDSGGRFTYTPADAGGLVATDSFVVSVSDAAAGVHLHGLAGLLNMLTFGLIGSAGHTTTRTVTISRGAPVDPRAYLVPVAPGVIITPLLTVGDSPANADYPMVGAPDGLGLFDNGDGTFTLLMNHELSSGSGAVRAHGATGAFISRYVIDTATLRVLDGSDLIQRVFAWDAATQRSEPTTSVVAFNRFCSGDLAPVSAYSHNGLGTTAQIFLTGQEGGSGLAVATVATGADTGSSYVLGRFNLSTNGSGLSGVGGWENLLANPFGQDKTVVIGNNDGGTGIMTGALAVYVGTKQSTGTEADKAGLTNGVLKFVTVAGNPAEIVDSATRATNIAGGTAFTLSSTASTTFSRPEDGAWNPLNPNEYFFVTTDRLDQVSDGVGGQVGRSRLWRLTFTDITNPDLGGTIDLLVDADTADGATVNMLDNLTVDAAGRILIQEDTGGAAHNAKIWQYDIATDGLTLLARHDPGRFGDVGVAPTAPFTTNEESSGIVDAASVLGPGRFLATVMAHYPLGGALVEGGQLLALSLVTPDQTTPGR